MAMKVNGNGADPALKAQAAPPPPPAGNKEFLEAFKLLPESRFRTTDSGLKVAVISDGEGKALAKGMRVKVMYTGWLENGKQFDTSVGKDKPFEFVLGSGQVIKGWEEGMAGIKPGERRQIVVPAKLAYGDRQVGDIPPDSTLIFNVQAVAVEPGAGNAKGNLSVFA